MKKAGFFAVSLVAVMATAGAYAAIPTSDWVKEQLGTKANTADLGALAGKNTVSSAELDAGAVTADKIAAGAVTDGKLATDSVNHLNIKTGLVTAGGTNVHVTRGADGAYSVAVDATDLGEVTGDISDLKTQVGTNTSALATLNGEGPGSVSKQIADAIAGYATKEEVNKVEEDYKAADATLESKIGGKQDKLTHTANAGDNISIDGAGKISVTGVATSDELSALDAAYKAADTALKSELEGKINAASGNISDLQESVSGLLENDETQDTNIAAAKQAADAAQADADKANTAIAAMDSSTVATAKQVITQVVQEDGKVSAVATDLTLGRINMDEVSRGGGGKFVLTYTEEDGWALEAIDRATGGL